MIDNKEKGIIHAYIYYTSMHVVYHYAEPLDDIMLLTVFPKYANPTVKTGDAYHTY